MKTSELTGAALDWAVAIALGKRPSLFIYQRTGSLAPEHNYSTDGAQGILIMERENISVTSQTNGHSWAAKGAHNYSYGPTPLTALMRCYVASKMGDEVEIPEELK